MEPAVGCWTVLQCDSDTVLGTTAALWSSGVPTVGRPCSPLRDLDDEWEDECGGS